MTLPLSDEETARRKRAFVYANQDGGKKGAVKRAAEALGLDRPTFSKWLGKQRSHTLTPQKYNPPASVIPKPRIRVKAISQPHYEDGPTLRVMAIGDPHDKPGRDKRRFTWMGRHAAETRPDVIVSIGDWCSADSLSTHELPGSANDAERPGFWEELDSLSESLALFAREYPGSEAVPRIHCHGNHEHRTRRAANRQPKLNGDMPVRLENAFAQFMWRTHEFGEFVDIGGVDFVHIPLSIMGKEMGGEMVLRNVGLKALRSTVFGHVHRYGSLPVVKVGQQRAIRIVSLATSMPYGEIEKYNGMSMTGWDWGVHEFRICNGIILSEKFWDMRELEQLYRD
jgi:hypothetical protein